MSGGPFPRHRYRYGYPQRFGKDAAIFRSLIQGCWFCYKWLLVLAIVAAVALGVHWYLHLDKTIRGHILRLLDEHYPQHDSEIASVRLVPDQGIIVQGLRIQAADASPTTPPLLEIDELVLVCRPQLDQLLTGNLRVESVICRRPTLRATRGANGQWDVSQLWPPPTLSDRQPAKLVEQGRLEILCDREWYRYEDLSLTIEAPQEGRHKIAGQLRGGQMGRCDFFGWYNRDLATFAFEGEAGAIHIDASLWKCFTSSVTSSSVGSFPMLPASLEGRLSGTFQIAQTAPQAQQPPQLTLEARLDRGKVVDPRLPEPLEQIVATIQVEKDVATLISAKAVSRSASWTADGQMALTGTVQQARWNVTASQLQLPKSPPQFLSAELQTKYTAWQPAGPVNLQLQLEARQGTWYPTLTIECQGVDFRSPRFPYPVHAAVGELYWTPDRWNCQLTARAGKRPVTIRAELETAGDARHGFVHVAGQDLRMDSDLINALPPKVKQAVSDLRPTGTFDVDWQSQVDTRAAAPAEQQIDLTVHDSTLRYRHFPIDLRGVRGRIKMQNGHWDLLDFQGRHGSAVVTCEGTIRPVHIGSLLALRLTAHQVPLNKDFRETLRPEAQRLWDEIQPRGRVNVVANITHQTGDAEPQLTVGVQPVPGTTSIDPRAFPYRWENVQGNLTFHAGSVSFDSLSASHGNVQLRVRGQSESSADGWRLALRDLHIDNLVPDRDRELLLALPPRLRGAITRLEPKGSFHLSGGLDFSRGPSATAPLQSAWDLHVTLHDNSVQVGVPLKHLHGEVHVQGSFDGQQVGVRGNLDLDSAQYGNLQWTGVQGPLWYDGRHVLFGKWADSQQTTRLTGRCYGGRAAIDGWITEGPVPRFQLQLDLANSDLNRLASEGLGIQDRVQGKLFSSLQLGGDARGRHTLQGEGRLQLRDADIGELPAMVQLLKVLSAKEPDATAFTASNVDFQIRGEHIRVLQLELLGDAVSLYGQGEIGFDLQSQLMFRSLIGRTQLRLPLLRDLVNEASQQILQIHVSGPIYRPNVESRVLPLVSGALEQLEADLQPPRPAPPGLSSAAGAHR